LIKLLQRTGLFLCLVFIALRCYASEQIVVVYPDLEQPYSQIFETIIEGIGSGSAELSLLKVKDKESQSVGEWFSNKKPSVIIALGSTGYRHNDQFPKDIPLVFGAVRNIPPSRSGVSLNIDPANLFHALKNTNKAYKRLYVVYNPKRYLDWIILAKSVADDMKIEVVGFEASSLREAMDHYKTIFDQENLEESVLWLPLDSSVVNNKVVIPYLLKESWDKNLAVASSVVGHVKRGLLMSIFPDNQAMGLQLAQLALERHSGSVRSHSKQARFAINTRTARHLGIIFNEPFQEQVEIEYPSAR